MTVQDQCYIVKSASGALVPTYAEITRPMLNFKPDPHTLWAVAQIVPGEGIEDGVARIAALLAESRDCRTCSHMYWIKAKGVIGCESPNYCVNADRYDPMPPVQLWRREP